MLFPVWFRRTFSAIIRYIPSGHRELFIGLCLGRAHVRRMRTIWIELWLSLQLHRLEPYFEMSFWAELMRRVGEDDTCDDTSGPDGRRCRWVQCDACLVWLHFECVGL